MTIKWLRCLSELRNSHGLHEIKTYNYEVVSNDMMIITSFMKIPQGPALRTFVLNYERLVRTRVSTGATKDLFPLM
jgi:hypothetical protein